MKELKINGVISIPADMTLQQFCEMFNEIMDKYDFGFSAILKSKKSDFNGKSSVFTQFFFGHERQKKTSRRTCLFLSNPKDWYVISRERVCNRRKAYVITLCVYVLRIDYIHFFEMITFNALLVCQ